MAGARPRPDNSYRLVLFEAPGDLPAVRDLIAGVTGQHPTDVTQWAARAPGIWPHPLAEGEVREILDGLFELGVPAEARRVDLIPKLAPVRTLHDVACLGAGLRARGLRGEPTHLVPWNRIELISAGMVEQPDELRVITPPTWVQAVRTGLNALLRRPSIVARRERSIRIERGPTAEVLIVRSEPRRTLRVDSAGASFAYLGDRKRPTASENFRLFLSDLRAAASDAYVTHPTRALLGEDANPATPTIFPSSQALLDYSTHRLLWSWYRRDRDGDPSSEP
jgi:hypothetical protein